MRFDPDTMADMSDSDKSDATREHSQQLDLRQRLTEELQKHPYNLICYLERAVCHSDLGYPDLAASDAYRALMLTDEVSNEGFEYHQQAYENLRNYQGPLTPKVLDFGGLGGSWAEEVLQDPTPSLESLRKLAHVASIRAYQMLSLGLLLCGCLKSAATFCKRGLEAAPDNKELLYSQEHIKTFARRKLGKEEFSIDELTDHGLVRREVYPWNDHNPDRFAPESLAALNNDLKEMAPKCEVQVATLPVLLEGASDTDKYEVIPTCQQLGVFAKEDIPPGEAVLREYSLLTANNRLKDALCDACSCDLPALGAEEAAVNCEECHDTVFCGQYCHDQAQERYHPAVCEKDVDAIAKDPDARESDETLHLLLLSRVLALAAHQEVHPLEVREVKFIWGDFVPTRVNDIDLSPNAGPPPEWTLPFSFKYNIETPLHILEKMDIDIYATLANYDLWVLNTLFAKFRGTASARKSLRDGRPDVAAVHPYWCLANHDCDPNVTWNWGGRMVLWAREERSVPGRAAGIQKGEEILNHYCDINLPVDQRREWACGSLGGWCMCKRCRDEALANDTTMKDG